MTASREQKATSAIEGLKLIDAVNAFSALARPSQTEKDAIEALALPLITRLDGHALRQIATSLAQGPQTPSKLAMAVALLEPRISSAFIALSPALSKKLLLEIIASGGLDHARAIARRSHLPVEVRDALRTLYDEKIDRALDLRQKPDKTLQASMAPKHGENAIFDGESPLTCTKTDILDLIDLARSGHVRAITTFLSDKLDISMESAGVLVGNLKSGNLLHALRVMDFNVDEAWGFYSALAKGHNTSEALESRFRKAFSALTHEISLKIVNGWRLDDIMERCLSAPVDKDDAAA